MLFNTYIFLFVFLPLALVCVHGFRALQAFRLARLAIIALSILFYGWWDWRFVPLLMGSALFNWITASVTSRGRDAMQARLLLAFGIAANLAVLAFFKYGLLFADLISFEVKLRSSDYVWILPLGISFWTFEQIIYLVECYRGRQLPVPFEKYLLLVTFFPRLISGPIIRPSDFFHAFEDARASVSASMVVAGLSLVAIGLAKKVCLADQLGLFVDPIFKIAETGHAIHPVDAWAGMLGFTFQIYFDFSGYSDIAIGLALLFGVPLPANFHSPYKSTSIIEFWRRWHISLSSFLRDYLYIPIGGNRSGPDRQMVNIMVTMGLGGLWHGAGINFLFWGLLHGFYVVLAHGWRRLLESMSLKDPVPRWLALPVTFAAVSYAWIFFRADSWIAVTNLSSGLLGHAMKGAITPVPATAGSFFPALLILYAALHCLLLPSTTDLFHDFLLWNRNDKSSFSRRSWSPTLSWALSAGAMVAMACWLMLGTNQQFIYFQF